MGFDMNSLGGAVNNLGNFGEIKNVWDNLRERNWGGLIAAIQKVRQDKGTSDVLDTAEQKATEAQQQGREFPNNPADLASMFDSGDSSNR